MTDRIEFTACLAGANTSARWLAVSAEGDAKITLETPASELASVIRLALYAGRLFRVVVEPLG